MDRPEIDDLSDYEFTDALRAAMNDSREWLKFREEERVDRTAELLLDLSNSLEAQLSRARASRGGADPEWRKKVQRLKERVLIYYRDAKDEIRRLNIEEAEAGALGDSKRWKHIAGLLADLLEGNPALGLIPVEGGITAAEWVRLRRAKAARNSAQSEEVAA